MKKLKIATFIGLVSVLFTSSVYAGTTKSYSLGEKPYPGSVDRKYRVYEPSGLGGSVPMVMVLHGCQQTEANIINSSDEWGMRAAADKYGFILVAPFITSYDGARNTNCWGFWFDEHIHEGKGEPEDLYQIALQVESNYDIDPTRRFITGLSSGGAIALVAAITHNEYWAAAAPAAGLPYSETSNSVNFTACYADRAIFKSVSSVVSAMRNEMDDEYRIPIMVLNNQADCTVLFEAATNVRDSFMQLYGTSSTASSNPDCEYYNQNNFSCKHSYYEDSTGRSLVETIFYNGPTGTANFLDTDHGHYWVGGANGSEGKWAVKSGPSYPDLIWDFFNRHPRVGADPQKPTISLNGNNPMQIDLNVAFTDPGAAASDPQDGAINVNADCSSVDTTKEGTYTCTYSAQDSDGNLVSSSRTVNVGSALSCKEESDTPAAHVSAGRAAYNLWGMIYTTGDDQYLGNIYATTKVTLYEKEGKWYKQKPADCGSGGGSESCWTAILSEHMSDGRAETYGGYVCKTVGGGDQLSISMYTCEYLKQFGGNPVYSIQETSSGEFHNVVSCP